MTLRPSIKPGRTVPDSNEPHVWLLARKALINHAERHRGSSACELMDWLNCEVRGSWRGTTAMTSQYPQGGEVPKSYPPQRFLG